MSCAQAVLRKADTDPILTLRGRPRRIVLIGNANVGKSVLFGRLTGKYAVVSNYPGTTVAITSGRALLGGEVCEFIDTPGVTSLEGSLSEDELVTRRILEAGGADLVIQVADARNLRRALMLTSQLAGFGLPMVLALNMMDEARACGIATDLECLASCLGVPVVETVATEGRGISDLRVALGRGASPAIAAHAADGHSRFAHDIASQVSRDGPEPAERLQERLGRLVREPLTGLPILAVVLYVMYLAVGVFGAQVLSGFLEARLFRGFVNPGATAIVEHAIPWAILRDVLVGEYGLITMGLTYAIAIVLPVVATFFLVFSYLEDSGYIPRLAIFGDRLFRTMGLNGKAVLPMVLGLGCDTMATMTTRVLGTRKERLITVLLLALGIPCSAQLATILGILGGISFAALSTLFGVVLLQMVVVGFFAARILPGERSEFIMELPPLRLPVFSNVARKTLLRVRWYLGEAVPLFLAGTALLFVMSRLGLLAWLTRAMEPLVSGLLGLPPAAASVFLMGFLRRDYGAAGLFVMARAGELDPVQAVVALTVMTLFVPCVANFLMIVKEQGMKAALGILAVVTFIALGTGTVLNTALRGLHVSF